MRTLLKFLFYDILCPLLILLGLDRLFREVSRHKRLIIMYHGVAREHSNYFNGRHLPVNQFERQLIYFRKNFDIIPLRDLCAMRANKENPVRHTIALTFDDGYVNFISNAMPLLEKYQVPATLFISTAALNERGYIQPTDYLDLINFSLTDSINISGREFKKGKFHLVDADEEKSDVYKYVNSLGLARWTRVFSDLSSTYPAARITRNVDEELYRVAQASEIESLCSSGLITVASHSHLHIDLTVLSDEEAAHQLLTSQECLRQYACALPDTLAFPFGYFDDRVIGISENMGYKFLIAAGHLGSKCAKSVFPRIGILNLASFAYNILTVNRAFRRFGF